MAINTVSMTNTSGSNTNGYYCKMGDGTLIQWGGVWVPNGDWTVPITFPIPFVDTNYRVTASPWTGVTSYNTDGVDRTVNGIVIGRTPNTSGTGFDYIAIGRWK